MVVGPFTPVGQYGSVPTAALRLRQRSMYNAMKSFYELGIEYANEDEGSDDAWERAVRKDPRVVEQLAGADEEERQAAYQEFHEGWVRGLQFPDSKEERGDDYSL